MAESTENQEQKHDIEKDFDGILFQADDFEEILKQENVSIKTFETFKKLKEAFEDFASFVNDYDNELYRAQLTADEIRRRAAERVIWELEERENGYKKYIETAPEFYKRMINWDGYYFLDEYLAKKTEGNKYPMDNRQVANYVWELIAIDIAKKNRGIKNVLDAWTDANLYSRWEVIK
ncbi:hypothetical protein SORDD17_01651 [Streptococcus oralis]|uniref:Uncharacterized protein n=1 Tax=Streptococcus oralis TaxID=1303 RepID=A0A139RG00_STROR|nr:hypothetical protein [Streptococcus oralis]KXU13689.1 hypothetical protein SORDD17_01651 [Streptococcus oralis]